jgi:hypothetical protein
MTFAQHALVAQTKTAAIHHFPRTNLVDSSSGSLTQRMKCFARFHHVGDEDPPGSAGLTRNRNMVIKSLLLSVSKVEFRATPTFEILAGEGV